MSLGGGGGGDGGAGKAEEERKAKRDAGVKRINQIFGIEDEPAPTLEQFARRGQSPNPGAARAGMSGTGYTGPTLWGGYLNNGVRAGQAAAQPVTYDQAAYSAAMKDWEARRGQSSRDPVYNRVRQGVRDFFGAQLTEQQEDARRTLADQLARQGMVGSSLEVDQGNLLRRREDDALAEIASRAERAALEARSADEQARMDAIQAINADVDSNSVATNATRRLAISGDQALETAKADSLDDFFGQLAFIQRGRDNVAATGRAVKDYWQRYGAGNPSLAQPFRGR